MTNGLSFHAIFPSILLVPTVIFLDQVSKSFAGNFLSVTCNKGIAFGIGNALVFVPVFALVIIFWLLKIEKSPRNKTGLMLILSGGVSNLIDRIYHDCVRDFISISKFPLFNLADIAITIGALVLVLSLFKKHFH